jgi:hypothetical protein
MTHHDDRLAGYALLGFGAGIYTFFKGFRQFRNYRLIADTPEIPIRSIPMGFVEIHGKARSEQTVRSPVSHTPCFTYKVVIERWKTNSQGRGGSWSHHRTDVDGVSFYLADATGQVLVNPREAELDLPQSARCEAGRGGSSSAAATEQELLQYVSRANAHLAGSLIERGLKFVGPLGDPNKEQQRQAIMGALQHTPGTPDFARSIMKMMAPKMKEHFESMGPQSDPKKEQARQLILDAFKHPVGSPEFLAAVRRANETAGKPDLSGNFSRFLAGGGGGPGFFNAASGRYRFTEYCIVPEGDYDVSGTCVENSNPRDEHDRNMIVKGMNEKVFLISSKSEKELESGLRKRAVGMILGGAALSVVCLAILLAKLGWLF